MFDLFGTRYDFQCPADGESTPVTLSQFRSLERLPGASSPAIYRVRYCCQCGDDHDALLSHDQLDWEPLGSDTSAVFVNMLTGSSELVATEMNDHAATMIRTGNWPWLFYCFPEGSMRPGFPSSLRAVAPSQTRHSERCGVLVRCISCQRLSINLVSSQHLDVPFFNDERVQYVDRMIVDERMTREELFRHELRGTGSLPWYEQSA